MAKGYELFGRALLNEQVEAGFYLMGGPINDAVKSCIAGGISMIDVRHEQAAAMAAHAYSRITGGPAVCMGCSGPGAINLTTGLANALIDCAPVVAFGGASPLGQNLTGSFQEIDQLAIMRPVTKWGERVLEAGRIPEYVNLAFRHAMSGKPGPVYLDLPGDVLYAEVDEGSVRWPRTSFRRARQACEQGIVDEVVEALAKAQRPIILSGTGTLWSQASEELREFVEETGIPFYTTPQGRGVVPEDHRYFYAHARSTAFREADLILVLGTRLNYVFSQVKPPRFSASATVIRVDTDPAEIDTSERADFGIVGDVRTVLSQLRAAIAGKVEADNFADWRGKLAGIERERSQKHEETIATDQTPIHPLRLCREVRDFIDRDTIMVVDGQEILNYGRQTIPSFKPGQRLNSGPFGTMGVGMPFGVGAKAARPDARVVVLHGDGSFGMNAMELDTSVRHGLPVLVVVSLNGGWTADPEKEKPGRDLGYTRFDKMAEALGGHGEFVEKPEDIRPALERAQKAVDEGRTALVNVVTDWRARSTTAKFTNFST